MFRRPLLSSFPAISSLQIVASGSYRKNMISASTAAAVAAVRTVTSLSVRDKNENHRERFMKQQLGSFGSVAESRRRRPLPQSQDDDGDDDEHRQQQHYQHEEWVRTVVHKIIADASASVSAAAVTASKIPPTPLQPPSRGESTISIKSPAKEDVEKQQQQQPPDHDFIEVEIRKLHSTWQTAQVRRNEKDRSCGVRTVADLLQCFGYFSAFRLYIFMHSPESFGRG